MQQTKFNKMCPYIEIKPFPINNDMDNFEEEPGTLPLFHVAVSQGALKMMFLVVMQDQFLMPKRRFEIVRCEYLSLHGIDQRDKYLETVDNTNISADPTIVNEIFEWTLKPYALKLLKVNFHNFEFFETAIENKGFIFEDTDVYDNLKDLINKKCIAMMSNPKVYQY